MADVVIGHYETACLKYRFSRPSRALPCLVRYKLPKHIIHFAAVAAEQKEVSAFHNHFLQLTITSNAVFKAA